MIQEKIITFIKEDLNSEHTDIQIQKDDDLLGTGLVESMGMMRIIQFVEDEFEVKVEPQDMTIDNFITVDAIANFVKSRK